MSSIKTHRDFKNQRIYNPNWWYKRVLANYEVKCFKRSHLISVNSLNPIMEFQLNNINRSYLHNIALVNTDTGKVFYKRMGYKFLELPNFDKREQDLETDLDKWFYLLNNLNGLDKIPDFLDKRVFQKIFKIAEMSKMTKEERELYHSDVKAKSDWNAGIRFAEKKADEKAMAEGVERVWKKESKC
ncbi:MAG: PD-(D/E)XK nuclease family transposase [Bacteroidia bacterium]